MWDELLSPLLETAWGRRLAQISQVAMVALLCFALINMVRSWMADSKIRDMHLPLQQQVQLDGDLRMLIEQIPSWHLFGVPPQQTAEILPTTNLQLQLLGVMKQVPNTLSRVIISEAGQPGKVYRLHDTLPSGAIIYEIGVDSVILENGGRLEKLLLQRQPVQFQEKPKSLLNEEHA